MYKIDNSRAGSKYCYLIDENGNDWYDYADNDISTNMKICVNEQNFVQSFSVDASFLNPINCNVYEVEEYPEDIENTLYFYIDGEFIKASSIKEDSIETKLLKMLLKNSLNEVEKTEFEELKSKFLDR